MTLTRCVVLLLWLAAAAGVAAQIQQDEGGLPRCVASAKWSSDPIRGADLWSAGGPGGAFVAVKTNAGNYALLSVSALETLVIESVQLFSGAGTLLFEKEYLRVPGGSDFDVDTGKAVSDPTADLRWNTTTGKRLEALNGAVMYRCQT